MMITSRRKPHQDFREVGRITLRVMPNDLDLLWHVNNGVYLALMDLGRLDLLIRSGNWQKLRKLGWYPVAASVTVTYRRSLTPWQKYVIETKVIGFDDKAMYVEHRVVRDNEVYVVAVMRARLVKSSGGTVSIAEIGEFAGFDPATMPIPEWMAAWAKDVALPPSKASHASDWG
jgi:acyl-CoA thioesterase FadM